ncbi:Maf family protein [Polycladidibacter hongkongensis]|uniref:Maf family protein n=1 Tax=Polycladidibacter hongkongensis TaxID=1647556 RepID=UPI00082FFA52|nr:Maf family protein [Pseudovibrio hongkongensis]
MTASLILASTSKIRGDLLKNAGLEFTAIPADLDERAIEKPLAENGASPEDIALELANAKALAVAKQHPEALVVGADQVLAFENGRLNKAKSMAEARARLLDFSGKPHALHSSVAVAQGDQVLFATTSSAHLHVRELSETFLDWYLATAGDRILSSVGAYQLEGLGIQLFERIEGDYFTILGLPLLPLLHFFREQKRLIP